VAGEVLFKQVDHDGGLSGAGGADETKTAAASSRQVYAAEFSGGDTIGAGIYFTNVGVHGLSIYYGAIFFASEEMDNKFLRDFMARQTQAAIIESPATEPSSKKGGKKRKVHKSKHGTASGAHPFGGDDLETRMATLISEKPAKKEVLAYFKDRIAQLVAEDEY